MPRNPQAQMDHASVGTMPAAGTAGVIVAREVTAD
jgi:hypothetical protein